MTDVRAQLADALRERMTTVRWKQLWPKDRPGDLADVLLALPNIAIVDISGEQIPLADGREVPSSAVAALDELDRRWPGATLPQARPAIAAALLAAANAAEQAAK